MAKIFQFPEVYSRKNIAINGRKYDTAYLEKKSMLPDIDLEFVGYYRFDLEEHGALYDFLFVEVVADNVHGRVFKNVLFDPVGEIVGFDLPVDALKAAALQYIAKHQHN